MTTKRIRLLTGFAVAVVVLALPLLLEADSGPSRGVYIRHEGSDVIPGELVLQFRDSVPAEQREALLRSYGATEVREMGTHGFVRVEVVEAGKAAVGEALAATDAVRSVEDSGVRYLAAAPNDPSWPAQWHLRDIGLAAARESADGTGALVAVLDSGVAFEDFNDGGVPFGKAPDLGDTDFTWPRDIYAGDDHPGDDWGHGTHVTGTIAENTDNGIDGAGIAPGATIMPVKVCGPIPSQGYGCPTTAIAEGIYWAVDHGANVINLSIAGSGALHQEERDALAYASAADVVIIAAAGNGGADGIGDPVLSYPAAVASVVSVGAVGILQNRAPYSNYGLNESGGLMDLVGPGGDAANEGDVSWIRQETYLSCGSGTQSYATFAVTRCGGTSMAAAHVTGVTALIRSKFPGLNGTQVRNVLRECALDLGSPGQDEQFGFGLVQADRSVRDSDGDGLPDCIDGTPFSPTPTPVPPANDCLATPTPTPSPSPTLTTTPTPTQTPTPSPSPASDQDTGSPGTTPTPSPSTTESPVPSGDTGAGGGLDTPTPTATPVDTSTSTQTETPTPTPTPPPTPSMCGDVDCNGEVDGIDSLGVLRWVGQAPPYGNCLGRGYVNCDGQLNALDAIVILRFSGGLPLHLPQGCSGPG